MPKRDDLTHQENILHIVIPETSFTMESTALKRSTSASRARPSSRPTTPLRPSSRTSLRDSQSFPPGSSSSEFPVESLEPAFAELSDSMADLEANFMHLQLMHESLSRFNESFASFLYGLNMNAFCVDFPEAPVPDSFKRARQNEEINGTFTASHLSLIHTESSRTGQHQDSTRSHPDFDAEATFLYAILPPALPLLTKLFPTGQPIPPLSKTHLHPRRLHPNSQHQRVRLVLAPWRPSGAVGK